MDDDPPYRALIADDEPHSSEFVRALVSKDSRFQVASVCGCGVSAIAAALEAPIDVAFLDVHMPRTDGFGVIDALRDRGPLIVLVTAYGDYAVRAYENEVFDYVTKPIDPERFACVLSRLHHRLQERSAAGPERRPDSTKALAERPTAGKAMVLNAVRQDVVCDAAEIQYLEVSGNYVNVSIDGKVHLVRTTLEQLCRQLDGSLFVRVHRSFVVNVRCVRCMRYGRSGAAEIEIRGGRVIPVSRGRRMAVSMAIQKFGGPEALEVL